jgi:hypothetical protein
MQKMYVMFLALVLSLSFSQISMAADAAATAPAKAVSCKQEAKAAGLKDKKEIKAFVKQCKADRKTARAK